MRTKRLDRIVSILEPKSVKNEFSELENSWCEFIDRVHAAYLPMRGQEHLASSMQSGQKSIFTIRWRAKASKINVKMRVDFDGNVYRIIGIRELGRRRFIEIECERNGD